MKKKLLACTLSSLMFTGGVALANDQQEFTLDAVVVTASRIEQTLLDAPAAVTIITQEQIQEKGAITLADALDGTPGVVISRGNGRSGYAIPYIAGTDMVVVMLDGVRLTYTQGSAYGRAGIDLNQFGIDPETIDRIEVIQGGNSALYGADAVGGVIQIFTKKGAKTPISNFGIALGDDGQAQYKIGTSGSKGKYDWRFNGSYYDTDGYRDNSYARNKNFSAHVGRKTNGGDLTFDYNYSYHKSGLPGEYGSPYASLTDYGYSNNHMINLAYQKDDFSLRYYYKNRSYKGFEYGSDFNHEEITNGLAYQDSKKLSENNLLTWGADLSVATVNSSSYDQDKSRWRRSFFVQDQMTFGKFILTPAVLYEMNNDFGNKTLPKISGVYKFDDKTSYFANWGKVFKAPSFDDLYFDIIGMSGNPDLKPEFGWSFETGLKRQIDEKSNASITFFNRHIKDRIAWVDMGNWTSQVQNIDSYKAQGVTIAVSKKFDKHWQADANYTYVDTNTNNPDYSEPQNQFYFGIRYENKKYRHSLSLESLSANDQYINVNRRVTGYGVVNTSMQYKISKDQRVYLNINNIFDKKYEQRKNYPANGINFMLGWDIKF